MSFFEITQDAAALMKYDDPSYEGIVTKNIETCLIYFFKGEAGLCVIHDSGQLKITTIKKCVSQIGQIKAISTYWNNGMMTTQQKEAHKERQKKILSAITYSGNVDDLPSPIGEVCVTKNGEFKNILHDNVEDMLSATMEKRNTIIHLNNFFLESNSQQLPIDIQYEFGKVTELPKLLKSKKEMEKEILEFPPKYKDDARTLLKKAENMGIFIE